MYSGDAATFFLWPFEACVTAERINATVRVAKTLGANCRKRGGYRDVQWKEPKLKQNIEKECWKVIVVVVIVVVVLVVVAIVVAVVELVSSK